MHPIAVQPAELPGIALPLLDLAASVEGPLAIGTAAGDLGAALDAFTRAWQQEGAALGSVAREQVAAVVRAAELYERLEATLVLGSLR